MDAERARVRVDLAERGYDIDIGPGLLATVGGRVFETIGPSRATVVTDTNVGPLYLDRLLDTLSDTGIDGAAITVPAGEESKSVDGLIAIYDQLAERRHSRDEPIIALGGGVVGDLAGFAAATWLRGVPFVQCPTTLEADIDASVGGKTAINHPAGKNLVGAFHQPRLVLIDTDCLKTLAPRDFAAGLAESVKHAVIRDVPFLEWHEANATKIRSLNPESLTELVRRNCRIKADVVEGDEREERSEAVGRAALNFGHTIGHAIEAQAGYSLRHGEAVSLGMVAALDLSVRCRGLPDADRARVEGLLAALGLPVNSPVPLDVPDLLTRLGTDKKVRAARVRFVVTPRLGAVDWLVDPPLSDLEAAIARVA